MATTSLSLTSYWEQFIRDQIATGRYGSASEVVRAALRALEDREANLQAMRKHLSEGRGEDGLPAVAIDPPANDQRAETPGANRA